MSTSAIAGIIMLVGSYGSASDSTIHTYTFDCEKGQATLCHAVSGIENPSFLALADGGKTLLAVNENPEPTAGLTMLRQSADDPTDYVRTSSCRIYGAGPCHVTVSPDGKYAVASNYSGGSISIVPFDGSNNSFGTPTVIQFDNYTSVNGKPSSPRAHFTSFTPDNRLMVVDDLGTDRLHTFPIGPDGNPIIEQMSDVKIESGSGPRHLIYDNKGQNAYLINELGGTVTQLSYDSKNATLEPVSTVLADTYEGHGSGDIHLSPDGRFLYASNRLKGDGIAIFAVNQTDGSLSSAGYTFTGTHPRNFAITPDGRWLLVACRDDNRIEVYERDSDSGSLTHTSDIPCPRPVCIIFNKE